MAPLTEAGKETRHRGPPTGERTGKADPAPQREDQGRHAPRRRAGPRGLAEGGGQAHGLAPRSAGHRRANAQRRRAGQQRRAGAVGGAC